MKAVVFSQYGSAEQLKVKELAKPVPAENEVLIKVHAVEATKADCELRSFNFPVKWHWLPLRLAVGVRKPRKQVLGTYFAGEIESVGRKVSTFTIGDRVFGAAKFRMGAYAEFLCLPENYTIVPMPSNSSYIEAAAVPLGGLNALHFLAKAKIQKGDTILINGAGGSIGLFAIQISKAMGAEVTAVDKASKEGVIRQAGADHFIDYKTTRFWQTGESYDAILSTVALTPYSCCTAALKPNGRYLIANPRFSDIVRAVFTSQFSLKKAIVAFAGETPNELRTLGSMIENGTLKPIVDRTYSIEQAAAAHRRVETEQRLGAVILELVKSA